jgi:hypothetical protein
MIRVELTPEESVLMREFVTVYLADFRREVARTEHRELRHALQRRQEFLEELLRRLPEPTDLADAA